MNRSFTLKKKTQTNSDLEIDDESDRMSKEKVM